MSKKNFLAVGSLGVSLLIHLLLFLTVSGVILIQAVAPKQPFTAVDAMPAGAPMELPPELPPDDTPPTPDTGRETLSEAPAVPQPSFDQQIVSSNAAASAFTIAPTLSFNHAAGSENTAPAENAATVSAGDKTPKPGSFSVFGSVTPFNDAMRGSIYDLRKKPDGRAVKTDAKNAVPFLLEAFVALHKNHGDRAWLDRNYYKGPTTLYASSVFIPPMSANLATTAFKAENLVGCPGWLAIYEGWMTPPQTGEYRFVGFADDNMLVIVNNKTVLHAFWPGQVLGKMIPTGSGWEPRDADTTDGRSAYKNLPPALTNNGAHGSQYARYSGNWIPMEKGTAYKVVIILSEAYGGAFSAMLAIEQRGVEYPTGTGPARQPRLPIFKLSRAGAVDSRWPSDYDPAGPVFGLAANGVAEPKGE